MIAGANEDLIENLGQRLTECLNDFARQNSDMNPLDAICALTVVMATSIQRAGEPSLVEFVQEELPVIFGLIEKTIERDRGLTQ